MMWTIVQILLIIILVMGIIILGRTEHEGRIIIFRALKDNLKGLGALKYIYRCFHARYQAVARSGDHFRAGYSQARQRKMNKG